MFDALVAWDIRSEAARGEVAAVARARKGASAFSAEVWRGSMVLILCLRSESENLSCVERVGGNAYQIICGCEMMKLWQGGSFNELEKVPAGRRPWQPTFFSI